MGSEMCIRDRVDAEQTVERRKHLDGLRVYVELEVANEDDINGPTRYISIPSPLAEQLNITEGDLLEIHAKAAAPLRGWAKISKATASVIPVGPVGIKLLNAKPGEIAEIRPVSSVPAGVL